MFKLNQVLMVFGIIPALAVTQAVIGSEGTLEFKVKGVVCAMCVQGIRKRVETLSEVQSVEIDLKQGRVRVTPRHAQLLSREAVVREIEKSGYDVSDEAELVRSKELKKKEQVE